MGCVGSKQLEEQEAVALCRERSALIGDAVRLRFALADSHAAHARSLLAVGAALHAFLLSPRHPPPASPVLTLPAHRKGEPLPPPSPAAAARGPGPGPGHSHSHSGSHIQFYSSGDEGSGGDDDDDDDDDFHLHSTDSSPLNLHPDEAPPGPAYVNISYARSRPPAPSVSYEQRPQSPETVRFGSAEPPPYYGYSYPPPSANSYPYPYPYMGYGGMGGGFYGPASPPPNIPPPEVASPSASRTPPPPPSPPRASTWDFLNPFETFESFYAPYTPSRSSKEVREEEGIPDLEDEEHEVVKEVYGDQKSAASTSGAAEGEYSAKAAKLKEDEISSDGEELHRKSRSVETGSSSDHEVPVVEKNVVSDQAQPRNVAAFAAPPRTYGGVSEVVQEIKTQFDRAADSASEVAKMLEVGKLPYHQKNSVYKASAMMICGMAPPATSGSDDMLTYEEDKAMKGGNLSSTLQKLYMWENKLLEEIKTEEKMRVHYDRKCEQLKRMAERGAEADKLEATQASIRKLSTKIRIAIQIVDTISNKISKLRDEELWPQVTELIQGLMQMWRLMLECYHIQCQATSDAKILDSIVSGGKLSEAHMEATKKLELELLEWIGNFSAWINAQRGFVKSLNNWLLKGLKYEPEETDDGVPPFSPGRLGAPPVFVICNNWSQTMDMISEREVVEAIKVFAANVLHLWEQNKLEQRQRLMANKDMDRALRVMERDEQQMRKAVEAQNKKLDLISRQSGVTIAREEVHQGSTAESSLLLSLKHIFEAMENFTASSLKAYEDLHLRAEEEKERMARENAKVP